MATGHGSLWLGFAAPPAAGATPGPGELVRVDAQTLTVTAHWPIVGSPAALVVTDHYVWVAGDIFDGRPPAQNANRVQQFDLAGKPLHTYAVDGPTAMAAQGDSVWVVYGPPSSHLVHLHDGIADTPLRLGGANEGGALVVCSDGVYVASVDHQAEMTVVDHIVSGKPAAQVKLPGLGLTVLGCGPHQGVLAVTPDPAATTVQQLFVDGRDVAQAKSLPGFSYAMGISDAGAWIGLRGGVGATTQIWLVDKGSLRQDRPLTIPVDVGLSVADNRTLWTVTADPQHPNAWIVIAIAAY
jgi:hypothetical protein